MVYLITKIKSNICFVRLIDYLDVGIDQNPIHITETYIVPIGKDDNKGFSGSNTVAFWSTNPKFVSPRGFFKHHIIGVYNTHS